VSEVLAAILFSTLDYAPAVIFAALGAVLSERSGVVNIGVEGMMRVGAFAAAVAALGMPTGAAVILGMIAGGALASIHAYLSIRWRSDQVVSGMALNLVALAGITFLLESRYSPMGTPSIAQLHRWTLPLIDRVPLLRELSNHSVMTYLAFAIPFGLHLLLFRTPLGLRIRAIGEKPLAAATLGVGVAPLRYAAVICGGLLAGLGGATLSTATLDRFEQHMPAGLGFIALAAMVFGRWTPLGAFGAAAFFAAGNALRIALASSAPKALETVPQGFLLALPYLLTILLLAIQGKRTRAPAALGIAFNTERS
jgi:simple sugar transport system permease protein